MKKTVLITGILIFNALAMFAQKSEVFNPSNGAIHGYDPVAYFKESKPVKGDPKLSLSWKGASWNFSNQQNLDAFKSSPETYAPQYGGYCAYGLTKGKKVPASPDAWAISNGKLYLNYDKDVQAKWKENQKENIEIANSKWPTVKNQE
ncbi:MAG: YHS domain-containing (seleno)protein [Ginsengibacter sp.]